MASNSGVLKAESPIAGDEAIERLREKAASCKACPLWEHGTQTVFGEGSAGSKVLMVGEQPGDKEDIAGRPFVGPAGQLLDRALIEANIDRASVYITNAVKHFKWTANGGRRLHQKPNRAEVKACSIWLEQELEVVQPQILVCLGATAAQALLGPAFRLTQHRGEIIQTPAFGPVLATLHPAAVLRASDLETRQRDYNGLVEDFKLISRVLV